MMDTSSYPEAVAAFRSRFETCRNRPVDGVNFMTPDFLGFVRDTDGVPVEITTGWFIDHRVYGVVWPRPGVSRVDQRDCLCHTLDEVADALGVTA